MKITIVGTGYVGLTTGLTFAQNGHKIIFYDIDKTKIAKLKKQESLFYEKGIVKSIKANFANYQATDDSNCLNESNIFFICLPTPALPNGEADLTYLNNFFQTFMATRTNLEKSLIVVKSTVPIQTNSILQKKVNELKINAEIASNPEFLSQGTAMQNSLNPYRIIIGTQSEWARKILTDIYADFDVPLVNTDLNSAELVKYACNVFQALKISFINEIANISEKFNANINDVIKGVGLDPVIGPKLLGAGIGYGGSCFPKDTQSLYQQAKKVNQSAYITEAIMKTNNEQVIKLAKIVVSEKGQIGILGLTFKPETDDTREAPAHYIIKYLNKHDIVPYVYDPQGINVYQKMFPNDQIKIAVSTEDLIAKSKNILLVTEWKEFKNLNAGAFKGKKIFDGRRIYNFADYQIGRGFRDDQTNS